MFLYLLLFTFSGIFFTIDAAEVGDHPTFLVADAERKTIVNFDLTTGLAIGYGFTLPNPVALALDNSRKLIFFSDIAADVIIKSNLDGSNATFIADLTETDEITPGENLTDHRVDGLAVDWLQMHVYFTDAGDDTIQRMTYDGEDREVIVSTLLDEPRAIVVDVANSRLYWTDWGQLPKIETSNLDGSSREVIVQAIDMIWPNGLVLDPNGEVLYWCDAALDRVESIGVNRLDRTLLAESPLQPNATHFFGMVLYQDNLYITDWRSRFLRTVPKTGGTLRNFGTDIFLLGNGIVVYVPDTDTTTTTSTTTTTTTSTTTTTPTTITSRTPTTSVSSTTTNVTPTQTTTTTVMTTGTDNSSNAASEQDKSGKSGSDATIIGIAVVGVVVLAAVVTIGVVCCVRSVHKRHPPPPPSFDNLASYNPPPYTLQPLALKPSDFTSGYLTNKEAESEIYDTIRDSEFNENPHESGAYADISAFSGLQNGVAAPGGGTSNPGFNQAQEADQDAGYLTATRAGQTEGGRTNPYVSIYDGKTSAILDPEI